MAGFAIDIGGEGSAYAQGVAMPQATSLDVLTQGLSLFAPQPKEKPTEASIQRAAYGELATAVNGLRGLDPLKQRVEAQRIRTEYEMAGFVFGDDEASLFESTLGIDMASQSQLMNPEQAMLNQSLSYLEENPSWVYDARNQLKATGEQYTQQDVVALAIQNSQAYQANLAYILNTTTTDRATFHSTWLPNAFASMDTVVKQASLMFDTEIAGGDVDPIALAQLEGEWNKFLGNFARPKGISNDDWRMFTDRRDAISTMLKTLKSYDADQLALLTAEQTEYMTRLNLFIVDEATKEDPLVGMAMWQNPQHFSQTFITNNWEDFTAFFNRPDLLDGFKTEARPTVMPTGLGGGTAPAPTTAGGQGGTAPSAGTGGAAPAPALTTTDLFDPDYLEIIGGMSDLELSDTFHDVTFNRVNLSTVDGMNDPTHRDNFLMGVGQASAVLAEGGRIIAPRNMELLFNEETYKKLAAIEKLDPEAAQLAREQLKDALMKQWDNLQSEAAGSLSSSPFKVVGLGQVEYDLDKKQGKDSLFQYTDEAMDLVRQMATKYYGGDVTRMIIERGRNLDSNDRWAVEEAGFKFQNAYTEYRRVLRISNEGQYLIDFTKKLGFSTDLLEQSLIKSQETRLTGATRDAIMAAIEEAMAFQSGGILPQIEDQNPLGYNAGNIPSSSGTGGILPQIEDQNPLGYNAGNIQSAIQQAPLDPEAKRIALAAVRRVMGTEARPTPDGAGFVPVQEDQPLADEGIRSAINAGSAVDNPLDLGAIDNDTVLLSIVSSLNVGQYFRNPGDGDVYFVAEKNNGDVILQDPATGELFRIGYRNGR